MNTAWAWPLPLLALAWLAWRVQQSSPRRAFALGLAYGTGWLAAGVWWLFISMHRFGGLPAPLAALAVLALALALSAYLGVALAAVARLRSGRPWADAALFASALLAAELARTQWFTGFPWLALGYSQVDSPLAALAPWAGVAGVGLCAALAAALLAQRKPWAMAALLAVPWALGPGEHSTDAGRFTATLLQTNVAQDEKFMLERLPATLQHLAQALTQAQTDLVVTPETAVPLLPEQLESLAPGYWAALAQGFASGTRHALVGVPLGNEREGYTNSVIGLGPGRAAYRYDKNHLVPFGEFIPNGFRWFTEAMNIPLGDFNRGPLGADSFAMGTQRLAPNICYEDLFGEELARRFARGDAQAPTVFVNISNIGWFGQSAAIPQHLHISRMRSLEFQRPMLRATNTGATAVIDHTGRVTAQLQAFTEGQLKAEVQGRHGLTPFATWASRLSLWPWWALSAGVFAWAWAQRRRRSAS